MHASSEQGTPQVSLPLTQKLIKPCAFGIFREASLHKHKPLNHRPLAIDSTSSPTPLPRGLASLGAFQSHLICITKDTCILSTFRKCHKFQLCARNEDKHYLFLIRNHNFTIVYKVLQGCSHTPSFTYCLWLLSWQLPSYYRVV